MLVIVSLTKLSQIKTCLNFSFTDFCRYLYIWQTMTMEERLQTLFQILNNGDPLTAETVTEVIRAVRPETEDLDQLRMIAAQMPASLSCLGKN